MNYKVSVLRSGNGYYIGQRDTEGCPYSRLSGYFKKEVKAKFALVNGFEPRLARETIPTLDSLIRKGTLSIKRVEGVDLLSI